MQSGKLEKIVQIIQQTDFKKFRLKLTKSSLLDRNAHSVACNDNGRDRFKNSKNPNKPFCFQKRKEKTFAIDSHHSIPSKVQKSRHLGQIFQCYQT